MWVLPILILCEMNNNGTEKTGIAVYVGGFL